MATFISTIKFTDQGMRSVGETTRRVAAIKTAAKKLGVKISNVYWTVGSYDGVLIFDAPDDPAATTFLLQLGSQGNVRTTTNRAFTAAEMEDLLPKSSEGGVG